MADEVDLMAHLERKRKEVAAMQEAANVAKEQALALLRLQRRMVEIDAIASGDTLPAESPDTSAVERQLPRTIPAQTQFERRTMMQMPGSGNKFDSAVRFAPEALLNTKLPETPSRTPPATSLSVEDRLRFGLEVPPESKYASSPPQSEYASSRTRPIHSISSSPPPLPPPAETPPSEVLNSPFTRSSPSAIHKASPKASPGLTYGSSLSPEDRRRFGLEDIDSYVPKAAPAHDRVRSEQQFIPSSPPFKHHPDVLWGSAGASPGSLPMSKTIAQLEAVGALGSVAELRESERRLQSMKMGR